MASCVFIAPYCSAENGIYLEYFLLNRAWNWNLFRVLFTRGLFSTRHHYDNIIIMLFSNGNTLKYGRELWLFGNLPPEGGKYKKKLRLWRWKRKEETRAMKMDKKSRNSGTRLWWWKRKKKLRLWRWKKKRRNSGYEGEKRKEETSYSCWEKSHVNHVRKGHSEHEVTKCILP